MRRIKVFLVMALVAAMAVLAGCGQKPAQPQPQAPAAQSQSQQQAPAAPAPAPAAPKPDLKVGVMLPYTGVYAPIAESMTNALQMYFDSIGNQVAGRKIVMIKEDTEANPEVGPRKARKLVEQDKVDITVGIVHSGVALAVKPYFDEQKALLVVSNAGADGLTAQNPSKYIFRTSFVNSEAPTQLGPWAAKNLGKNALGIAPDYAAGKDMVGGFKKGFEAAGGKMIEEIYPKLGTNDFAPYLAQIQQKNPDMVFAFFSGGDANRFVKQWEEFGLKGKINLIGAGYLVEEDVLKVVGDAGLGHYSALHWAYGLDTPANKEFVKAYEEKFKNIPDVFAVQGYETARFITDAIAKVNGNTTDKDALIKAMESTPVIGPRGENKINPATHQIIQNGYIRKVEKFPDGRPHNAVVDIIKVGN